MKIRVLATGSTRKERLMRRWGVSFLIDDDVLFDTFGDPAVLMENMKKMNVAAQKIKHIVLSHDHWDHTGGLRGISPLCNKPRAYIHAGFSEAIKRTVEEARAELIQVKDIARIKENVLVTGPISGYYNKTPILEQALLYERDTALSLITGCAHPGITRIITHLTGRLQKPISLIFGGFHLKDFSCEYIEEMIAQMKSLGVKKAAPTHCTGELATHLLREKFGKHFIKVEEGQEYCL
ncbi:MAG: MBL fold metallo-hydrolase [Candidatus Omnitrophica bacterium]|nr:MBL fold metallo-hydrolase [Candidatus Omnitrophota bacterium]